MGKKYEEQYRQAGDVASKLTIEEATFRDIQVALGFFNKMLLLYVLLLPSSRFLIFNFQKLIVLGLTYWKCHIVLNPLQEKKMELYRAIVKLEQDGGADGIQVLFYN